MVNALPNPRPSDVLPEQLDRVVDVHNISYAEARERLGMPPADNSMFTADRIQARNDAHQLHVELYHVPESPEGIALSLEAQASIRDSQQEARVAAAASRIAVR